MAVHGEHADAEHGGAALSDEAGSFEAVAQACVDRSQVVAVTFYVPLALIGKPLPGKSVPGHRFIG